MEQKNDRFAFKASEKRASALSALMGSSKNVPEIETIEMISLDLIDNLTSFPHPFEKSLNSGKGLEKLAESIKTIGLQDPIIVWPKGEGRYELLAGHRRTAASRLAGETEIKAIVRSCDVDIAKLIAIRTNLDQREDILPSEKAKAYEMQNEALKRIAGRPKKNGVPSGPNLENEEQHNWDPTGPNLKTTEILGKQFGASASVIKRYIRLNELIEPILDRVDRFYEDKDEVLNPAEKISVRAGTELSYLRKKEQEYLEEILVFNPMINVTENIAKEVHDASKEMELTKSILEAIVNPEPEKKEKTITSVKPDKPAYKTAFKSIEKYIGKLEPEKIERLSYVDQQELEEKIKAVIESYFYR